MEKSREASPERPNRNMVLDCSLKEIMKVLQQGGRVTRRLNHITHIDKAAAKEVRPPPVISRSPLVQHLSLEKPRRPSPSQDPPQKKVKIE